MAIVCNAALQHAEVGGAFVARAVPAWIGCVFSNGEACTEEMAKAMVASVADAGTKPPLLVDHVWAAEAIKGRMTSCVLDDGGKVVCEFAVYDDDSAEKIRSGEWESISITFEDKTYRVLECSIVAIPAVDGAKIEMADVPNAEDKPAEEPAPAETPAPTEEASAEQVAPAEEKPAEDKTEAEQAREDFMAAREETKAEDTPTEEPAEANECKRDTVANAKTFAVENARLKAEVKDLRSELEKLKAEAIKNAIAIKAKDLVDGWVAGGMTTPAQAEAERDFLAQLLEEKNTALAENYINIKNGMGNIGQGILGKRLSIANAKPMTEAERLAKLNDEIVAERMERRK